ncbi:MAG: hypothetical protein AB9872_16270 [Solidesulfovibrio sp.]
MHKIPLIFTIIAIVLNTQLAFAGSSMDCGSMPENVDSNLKGIISGKAQVLSKFLSDAQISGNIELTKKDIFSKYPNADRTRTKAILLYMYCEQLKNDGTLTTEKKMEWLFKIQEAILKD